VAKTAEGPSLIGAKIGNYSIIDTLGEGGMGAVYLAEHPQIGKRVAIKVLHPDHAARPDAAARCFFEARAVNEIRHPNVVDVIDCGTAELPGRSVHYLLMEHLEGEPLRALIRRGPVPAERAMQIAAEVGSALAAAHAKGIIHRDIKPENIFMTREGEREQIKVGIAKLIEGTGFDGRMSLTQSGVTLGTPQYMAPEQLDGEDIDGRVDVYALGIVLYEMLTGAAPFAEETTARGVWRRMNELPPLTDEQRAGLPKGLEDLLMRTLDPDRMRRPDMADLVRGLQDPTVELPARGGDPHTVRVPKRPATPLPFARTQASVATVEDSPAASRRGAAASRRWLGVVAGAGAIAIVVVLVIVLRGGNEATPTVTPTPVAPRPSPEPATIVTMKITTTPSGADVYIDDEAAPRGTSPLDLRLEKRSGSHTLRIVRPGYAELRRSVDTLIDDQLALSLVAIPVGSAKPVAGTRPPIVRTAPIDAGVADAAAVTPVDAPARRSDGGLGTNLTP
jgi:eukaryotic-like serine/threonine-protein kinase